MRNFEEKQWATPTMIVVLILGACVLLEGLLLFQYVVPLSGEGRFDRDPIGGDFVVFWSASQLASTGRVGDIFDYKKFHQAQTEFLGKEFQMRIWHYPPFFLFYVYPLSWLPYVSAYVGWMVFTFALLIATVAWNTRWLVLILALGLAPASFVNILNGQNGFLTAALFVGGMLCATRFPVLAGIQIGLLSYKPHLGLLLPVFLLAGRYWKVLLSACSTIVLLVVSSLLVHGPRIWELYLTETMRNSGILLEEVGGFLTYMMPTLFMAGRIIGLNQTMNYGIQIVVALLVMTATYWAIRRTQDPILQLAVVSVATFLASPYAYNYDMTLVSASIGLLVVQLWDRGFSLAEGTLLGLLWFLPIGVILLNALQFPLGPVIIGLGFIFLLRLGKRLEHHQGSDVSIARKGPGESPQ